MVEIADDMMILLTVSIYILILTQPLMSSISDSYRRRLHVYRKKYGFDRTLETADKTKKQLRNTEKINKMLDRREKTFNKNVLADPKRQDNETMMEFIKRRMYKV